MNRKRNAVAVLGAGALLMSMAACGGDDNGGGGGGGAASGSPWILGTTESVTAMDPAGSYDFGSWNMQYAIFQQLMTIPANGDTPEPDAAESCDYDDPQTITCKIRSGQQFSNGNELSSSDVLFSFKRNIEIAELRRAARDAAEVSKLMLTYLGQTHAQHEQLDLSEVCRRSLPRRLVRTGTRG